MTHVDVILLAAGEGTRLRPLTDHVPKPMLPIDGRAVIDDVLDACEQADPRSITIVTGYLGDVLRRYLTPVIHARPALGDPIYVDQSPRHGSGHALQLVREEHAAGSTPATSATTVLAATDHLWPHGTLTRMLETHGETGAVMTMGLRQWPMWQLPHGACTTVDADGRVSRVLGEPANADASSACVGSPIYIIEPTFWPYVDALTSGASGILELATATQRAIDDGLLVRGFDVVDSRDITRPGDVLRHNFHYLASYVPEFT